MPEVENIPPEGENVIPAENQPKIRENVLETFRKLTIDKERVLVKNGSKLLRHLVENQNSENGKNELKYAVCRLIRGLGASSNGTKCGFYTVLVGLLSCVDGVDVSDVLEIGNRELHTSSGNSKSENADISAGQILLYGAVVRSGMFGKANGERKAIIVEGLLSAGKKRDYLYLLAATFIDQICNNVDENYFKSKLLPIVSPELSKPWSQQTVDTVYLLFVFRDRFPNTVDKKYVKAFLGTEEIVSIKSLPSLAEILINMPRLETANHPIYDLISKPLSSAKLAVAFVSEADKLLVRYNYNRHTIFTLILTSIVANLEDVSVLPNLITTNYLQQTFQYFKTVRASKKPEQLQGKLYELFDGIVEALARDDATSETKIDVLRKLLFDPGTFIFEKITRTKTIQRIVAGLDQKGVKALADIFRNMIVADRGSSDGERRRFLNNDKVYAVQLLVKLLSHDSVKENFAWKIDSMKFLMELGFVRAEKYSHIGNELSGSIRKSFYKALTIKQQSFNDVRITLWKLAQHLNPYVKKNLLRLSAEDAAKTCWITAYETFETIERKEPNQLNHVYQTLFLQLAFHGFQDSKLAEDSLSELRSCFERINVADDDPRDDGDPHFSEVMVDLFLCLLSYNSSPFRNLVGMVFPHFARRLTDEAFGQILYVLDPESKDILGRKVGADDDDSESDEDSSESETDENQPIDSHFKEAVQAALGQFGDEEIDLDEMSETEGRRLDEALAAAFKKNVGSKKSKKQSHKENLKMNFRIRVLDLLEICFDNEPSMLSCVESLPILLRLQEHTIRDPFQRQLLDRIVRTVKKLSNVKKFGSVQTLLTEDKFKGFLLLYLNLLERGEKNVFIVQALRESLSNSCLFFIRCGQFLSNSNELTPENDAFLIESINNITTIALDSYFLQRDPLILLETFKTVFRTNFFGLYDLIDDVLPYVYLRDLKLFKKIQAVELAKDFFSNHRFLTSHPPTESFRAVLKGFVRTTRDVFEYSAENDCVMQEKFVRSLLDLLVTIKKSPVRVSYSNLIAAVKKYSETIRFSNVTKSVYNKFCGLQDDGGDDVDIERDGDEYETDGKAKKSLRRLKVGIEGEKLKLRGAKRKFGDDEDVAVKRKVKRGVVDGGEKSRNLSLSNGNAMELDNVDDVRRKRQSSRF